MQIRECLSLKPSFQSSVALLIQAITLVKIGETPPLYSGLHQIIASEDKILFFTFSISVGKELFSLKFSSKLGLNNGKSNSSSEIIELEILPFLSKKFFISCDN